MSIMHLRSSLIIVNMPYLCGMLHVSCLWVVVMHHVVWWVVGRTLLIVLLEHMLWLLLLQLLMNISARHTHLSTMTHAQMTSS